LLTANTSVINGVRRGTLLDHLFPPKHCLGLKTRLLGVSDSR